MNLHYPLSIQLNTGTPSYSSSVYNRAKCEIRSKQENYILDILFTSGSDKPWVPRENVKRIDVKYKTPDNSEYAFENVDYTFTSIYTTNNDAYNAVVSVGNDFRMVSTTGTVLGLLILYGDNDTVLGYGCFVITVAAAIGIPVIPHIIRLDFWAGALPTRIHVNQCDEYVQLKIYAYNSKGTLARTSSSGSTFDRVYLEGTRSDGVELQTVCANEMQQVSSPYPGLYTSCMLPKEFTEVAGETELQLRVYQLSYGSPNIEKEYRSSKIILIVEPTPHEA